MPDTVRRAPRTFVDRAARVAYTIVLMNFLAIAALPALLLRKNIWR